MKPDELSLENLIPNERTVNEMISLYEFLAVFGTLLMSMMLKNSFLASIWAMMILKQVPEKIFKLFVFKGTSINRRPKEAYDCNMINKGGPAWDRSGFPSGHTTVAFFLWMFLFLEYRKYNTETSSNIPPVLIITSLFAIIVPISRVRIKCHTLEQVSGGAVLGMAWAALFSMIIDPALEKASKGYREDKQKVLSSLFEQ